MDLAKYLRDPGRIVRKMQWRRLHHGPPRDVTVPSWNGTLTFSSRDRFISKYLCVDGAYERRTIENAMGALVRAGRLDGHGTLLDVGANIGMITTALLTHDWFSRAVCFEPSPANLRLLRMNVAQNGLSARVTVVGSALGDAPGEATFELSDSNFGDNRVRAAGVMEGAPGAYREETRRAITVPVDTLDHALAVAGVRVGDVRLLWMDIQGFEAKCLAGAAQTLAARVPVVMEFWPYGLARAGTSREAFLALVRAHFTSAMRIRDEGAEPITLDQVGALFDEVRAPNKMTQLLLLPPAR